MKPLSDILLYLRRMIKLYDRYMEKICALRRLSHLEITIISFLHNNPGCDTARDISEMRMLPKGNVSQGVESLIQKGLLGRETDGADRRRIHLTLTEAANPIVEEIEAAKALFYQRLFGRFTEEELRFYADMNNRILKNLAEEWEGNAE